MEAARRALERGRLVVFVLDQRHNAGIPVPFFGHPAWTSAAFAALVHRHRPRIFGSYQWRDAHGRLQARAVEVHWSIPEAREAAIPALTRRTQRWLEARVRESPGDWWWLHKRWHVPNASDTARAVRHTPPRS
jgi:KDO2-lipid IV(A) lauroyltransferase